MEKDGRLLSGARSAFTPREGRAQQTRGLCPAQRGLGRDASATGASGSSAFDLPSPRVEGVPSHLPHTLGKRPGTHSELCAAQEKKKMRWSEGLCPETGRQTDAEPALGATQAPLANAA